MVGVARRVLYLATGTGSFEPGDGLGIVLPVTKSLIYGD